MQCLEELICPYSDGEIGNENAGYEAHAHHGDLSLAPADKKQIGDEKHKSGESTGIYPVSKSGQYNRENAEFFEPLENRLPCLGNGRKLQRPYGVSPEPVLHVLQPDVFSYETGVTDENGRSD